MFRLFLFFCGSGLLVGIPPAYDEYGRLLDQYVTPEGVDYRGWHASEADSAALDNILDQWSSVDHQSLDREEASAFLINLYNAAMIREVLENYPLDSVREIGFLPFAVFRRDVIDLNGDDVSLDHIEKEVLLKDYFDPRIHFAVNCASVSCPPLRGDPFTGGDLSAQLDEQTRLFASSSHAAQVSSDNESTSYSELFKWYADDFPGDDPAVYLNRFRNDPLPEGNEVKWIEYDWGLNRSSD